MLRRDTASLCLNTKLFSYPEVKGVNISTLLPFQNTGLVQIYTKEKQFMPFVYSNIFDERVVSVIPKCPVFTFITISQDNFG